ncbi:hypothetical protein FB45DRAFT_1037916 [Roridomyces roridus]|uniref:Uncharacterized protein n=1 Tax=Roridomyces roridus TaxID=1738132 RepID=A0AAD7FBD8_9AGAR|nr:hypothetical protein FB45DRAFT_1037916 [Roridomyces roridus]
MATSSDQPTTLTSAMDEEEQKPVGEERVAELRRIQKDLLKKWDISPDDRQIFVDTWLKEHNFNLDDELYRPQKEAYEEWRQSLTEAEYAAISEISEEDAAACCLEAEKHGW